MLLPPGGPGHLGNGMNGGLKLKTQAGVASKVTSDDLT